MPRAAKAIKGVYEHKVDGIGTGVFYIRYKINGRLVRKAIGTRAAAINELDRVNLIRRTGNGVVAMSAKDQTRTHEDIKANGGSDVLLSILIADYLTHISDTSNPRAPSDIVNATQRMARINEAFGERVAGSIRPYEIEAWLLGLERAKRSRQPKPKAGKAPERIAAGTMNRYKSTFSSVYRYAKSRGKIAVNPVRDAQQFPVSLPIPRWLQEHEEAAIRKVLASWIDDCPSHHRLTRLFLRCHPHELTVAIGTGMRKGNQYGLMWEDVDFMHRRIVLHKTKTGKPLVIPMIDDVYFALNELKEIQSEIEVIRAEECLRDGRTPVRMIAGGRVFNIAENREWWNRALAEAKVKGLRWHDLRHTFGTRLMRHTHDIKLVQEGCGHKSINTTVRYLHVSQEELARGMAGAGLSRA